MAYSFKGGIKLSHQKHFTEGKAVEALPMPDMLYVPVLQHLGAPAKMLVARGDEVKKGQLLAEPAGFISAAVHAPTSGTIKKIAVHPHPVAGKSMAFHLEPDGRDEWLEGLPLQRDWKEISVDDIRAAVREAGIVGMGGAAFPTHVKLSPPEDKKIDTVLINGAECEPYLTSDHIAMSEGPGDLIVGTKLIMRAVNAGKAYIGVEKNKPDVIEMLEKALADDKSIEVVPLKTVYPQGAERSVMHAILNRQLPGGQLPMDLGVVVQNVNTAISIAQAVCSGLPVIDKIVTVTGDCVKSPKNLRSPIGAPLEKLIEFCGGFTREPARIVMGGPMMGAAQYTLEAPVVKATSGLLCLTEEETVTRPVRPCIRCGRCVDACPMRLVPADITLFTENGDYSAAQKANIMDCVECGSCTFVCPSDRKLVHMIRTAKAVIRDEMSKNKS